MSGGGGFSKSKSGSRSQSSQRAEAIVTPDLLRTRGQLTGLFGDAMNQQGTNMFGTPMGGPIASAYQNLFSPGSDWLGAQEALRNNLSGGALEANISAANKALQPSLQRNMELMGRQVFGAASPMGKRFSTDTQGQFGRAAQDMVLGTQQQALGAALQQGGQQQSGALQLMNLIGGLGEANIARQLPLIAQFASSFAPIGNFGESDSSSFARSFSMSGQGGFMS